ncbi:hypothetical protein BUE80_DR001952 [Diplocarpon rosae]|nr:hypothetical protein BUE80_DR001952 [Diplocarpon rosae]
MLLLQWGFNGFNSFAHLEHVKCLTKSEKPFDIAIIGVPFDTAVSYRPGARFGPRAIRAASSRQTSFRGFNARASINPYTSWATILDCGDIPVTPMDNAVALTQMTSAYLELGHRVPPSSTLSHPKMISLGGDHSLALAALRGLHNIYGGPIAVLHFDAHLDTWHPAKYPSPWPSKQSEFNHGSMFWIASNEGLILNGSSVHAGLRTRLSLAPGTGTPEAGGWTTRELIQILRGIEGLNIVGADMVEVAPAYDGVGEQTALAAAQVAYEILTSIVKRGLVDMGRESEVLMKDGTEKRGTGERSRDEL